MKKTKDGIYYTMDLKPPSVMISLTEKQFLQMIKAAAARHKEMRQTIGCYVFRLSPEIEFWVDARKVRRSSKSLKSLKK